MKKKQKKKGKKKKDSGMKEAVGAGVWKQPELPGGSKADRTKTCRQRE